MFQEFFNNTSELYWKMAPFLFLGLIVSTLLKLPRQQAFIHRHLNRGKFTSILKAIALGVPLPLCSCSVLPTSDALKKAGASRGALSSFLISTPITGADSILATYALMGPFFAWVRPLSAMLMGLFGGTVIQYFGEDMASEKIKKDSHQEKALPLKTQIKRSKDYFLYEFIDDISGNLFLGLIVAGLIAVFVPSAWFETELMQSTWGAMIILTLVGLPMYICDTGSIPMAVVFLMKGVSPGPVLVFLAMGAVTNAASIGIVTKLLGRKNLVLYFLSMLVSVFAVGLAVDTIVDVYAVDFMSHLQEGAHAEHGNILLFLGASGFSLIFAYSLLRLYVLRPVKKILSPKRIKENKGDSMTLKVEGMTCQNCVRHVQGTLDDLKIKNGQVDLEKKEVRVPDDSDIDLLKAKLAQSGYPAE